MAILRGHIPFYKEIFALPHFLSDPVLTFGFHDSFDAKLYLASWNELTIAQRLARTKVFAKEYLRALLGLQHPDLVIPKEFSGSDFKSVLHKYGLIQVESLDPFDPRATYQHDMNTAVDSTLHEKYNTVIDIGSLEHVFDARICLENLLRMVRVDGHLMLHTPCNGYFDHGFHTFSPEMLHQTLSLNGFDIIYSAFSSDRGVRLSRASNSPNTLIWLVGRKVQPMDGFVIPQQGRWINAYSDK